MIIPKFNFHIYPIIICISIIIGLFYIYFSIKKEKEWNSLIYLFFLLSIYTILVSAKFFAMITEGEINFFKAGLASFGGAIGLIGSSIIFELILHLKGKLLKYSIISLALIYGLSKIGCFLAGCCYGIPYNGLLSVTYPDGLNIPLFPVQLLESIVFIIIFFILNKQKNNKNIIYISLITMSISKFFLDYLRYEHFYTNFNSNQIVSFIVLFITVIFMFIKEKKET